MSAMLAPENSLGTNVLRATGSVHMFLSGIEFCFSPPVLENVELATRIARIAAQCMRGWTSWNCVSLMTMSRCFRCRRVGLA